MIKYFFKQQLKIILELCFCMISRFWSQFSEKMTISPSAILRSGRPDYEPQKSTDRKDLLIYESMPTAIQSKTPAYKKIHLFIIIIVISSSNVVY